MLFKYYFKIKHISRTDNTRADNTRADTLSKKAEP